MASGVFEDRTRLKDLILQILKEEESASISGIQKRLVKHGENLHRLIVTGYLRAMHDLGILEERDLPPSKVYSLKAGKQHDIYDAVGRAVASIGLPRQSEARLAVVLFERLFHRPVFKQELVRAQLEPLGLADWEVPTQDRQAARQRLVQAGLELPHNNPAYVVPDDPDPELGDIATQLIADLVIKGFSAHPYVMRSRQVTLGEM